MLLVYAPEDIKRELMDDRNEFPMYAVIAEIVTRKDGSKRLERISEASNMTNYRKNSTRHAELEAIDSFHNITGEKHLGTNRILISNVEPCSMCGSAAIHEQAGAIIFGVSQNDLRDKNTYVGLDKKTFRVEPEDYDLDKFARERSTDMQVHGGYRKDEVLRFMRAYKSSH